MYLVVSMTEGCDREALIEVAASGGASVVEASSVEAWVDACARNKQKGPLELAEREFGARDENFLVPMDSTQLARAFNSVEPDDHFRFLLFHVRPEAALIESMLNEQAISSALASWLASARNLISFFYGNRRITGMFAQAGVLTDLEKFAGICAERLGIEMVAAGHRETPNNDASDHLRLIAAYESLRDDSVRATCGELEACSLQIGSIEPDVGVGTESFYRGVLANGISGSGASELQEENELLLLQLNQVQQELEHYYLDLKTMTKQHASVEQRYKECSERLSATEREFKKSSESLKKALKKAQKKIDMMRRSTSWRLTLPMRVIVRGIKRLLGRG